MILTAHQPSYLPWLGFFDKLSMADEFVYLDQVQYQPEDFNNRNKIKTTQGAQWLSVPVLRKGYLEKTIADIYINKNIPWTRKHWKSIELAYSKAPFFDKYAGPLKNIYSRSWDRLIDLNAELTKLLMGELGISMRWHRASSLEIRGNKHWLILDLCRKLGADTFIFGAQGRNYVDVEVFNKAGISVLFQDYEHPTYTQINGGFLPNMSVIDLLFNCGEDSLAIMKTKVLQN